MGCIRLGMIGKMAALLALSQIAYLVWTRERHETVILDVDWQEADDESI